MRMGAWEVFVVTNEIVNTIFQLAVEAHTGLLGPVPAHVPKDWQRRMHP